MIPELDADPSVKQRLRESPKLWVRNALKHPIDPSRQYDFKTGDGEPLTHILDSESWIHPDQWGDINVLLLARGELKSTSTGWIESWLHDAYPQAHSYIIAPNSGQVKDFLEPIKETYIEMADMDSRRVTNNKQKQVFKTYQRDSEGSVDPVMGRIQSDSGYSEESVRGKHSQFGLTEETQDLTENVFNIFLPAIDQQLPSVSYFPTVFCIGTPKVTGSFYHELWDRSDKRTWDAETESWIQQESVDPYELSAEEIAELPGDIELDDGESYTVRGWHVDWFNSPLHSDADIARARKRMDDMEFANEVLAEFHEPEDNLLTTDDIRSTFSDEYAFRESPYNSDNKTVVVADWGGGTDQNASDTVLMAAEEITYADGQQSEYVVCELLFLDPNENRIRDEIQQYEDLLIKFDADVGLVDYGYGQQAMESLQHGDDTKDDSGYMNTVSAAKYGNVTDRTDIKWTTDDKNNKLFFTCDKSRSCTQMVESFRDDRWIIPRPDMSHSNADGVRLIDQLTAPYKTLSEGRKTGNKSVVIETPGNHRDDAFDLFTLAFLAFNTVSSDENIIQFSSSPRTGT